jgi:hypothetical protein
VNARKLHNLSLIALIVSYFLQFGAHLFAIAIIVRSVIAAWPAPSVSSWGRMAMTAAPSETPPLHVRWCALSPR